MLILLTSLINLKIHATQVITLAIGEWPPYTSSKNKKDKIAEIIVTEAFKYENIQVIYKYYPWKRAYISVLRGEYVGTFPWKNTIKRQNDFIVSKETIIRVKEVFFHLKSLNFHWDKYSDLKKYRIGGTIGYSHIDILANQNLHVEQVPREELNFKKLAKKRIDIVPSSYIVGYNIIGKNFTPSESTLFTNHNKPLHEMDMVLLISRKIPNGNLLITKFNKGLRKLKESGRYDEIILKLLN